MHQKKPKFLAVNEELTKQIKSMGISRFCPQIRYECTVYFHWKTSAWLSSKMPSLIHRKLNHRLEIVIAVLRDVPSVSVVYHSDIYQVSTKTFIAQTLCLCFNIDVKNSAVCSMSEIHCSFLTVTFACAHNYWKSTERNPTWLKIIYRSLLFWLRSWPQQEWRTLCYYEADSPSVITKSCKNLVCRDGDVFQNSQNPNFRCVLMHSGNTMIEQLVRGNLEEMRVLEITFSKASNNFNIFCKIYT